METTRRDVSVKGREAGKAGEGACRTSIMLVCVAFQEPGRILRRVIDQRKMTGLFTRGTEMLPLNQDKKRKPVIPCFFFNGPD